LLSKVLPQCHAVSLAASTLGDVVLRQELQHQSLRRTSQGSEDFVAQRAELLLRKAASLGMHTRARCLAYLGSHFRVVLDAPTAATDHQVLTFPATFAQRIADGAIVIAHNVCTLGSQVELAHAAMSRWRISCCATTCSFIWSAHATSSTSSWR